MQQQYRREHELHIPRFNTANQDVPSFLSDHQEIEWDFDEFISYYNHDRMRQQYHFDRWTVASLEVDSINVLADMTDMTNH